MKILSKSLKINFEGAINLNMVENIFIEHKIKPLRWAITEIDRTVGVLTLDFSYCERV